jgi:hypothetical protein
MVWARRSDLVAAVNVTERYAKTAVAEGEQARLGFGFGIARRQPARRPVEVLDSGTPARRLGRNQGRHQRISTTCRGSS